MTPEERIERLQRRYDRERRARLEAEAIAEAGLRELLDVNESLDERIRERTIELEEAVETARAAGAARDTFLAHVSHELRTPVNGLAGMLELLTTEVTAAPAREWLDAATDSADHLVRLIDRLLWFTDLRSTGLAADAHAMRVQEILDAAAERWRTRCAKAGQLLSVEPATSAHATVWATEAIHRAIDEVLDNVVTHAGPGAVSIVTDEVDDRIRFVVRDSGPGLPDAVTGVLETGPNPSTRASTGAGVGLGLVSAVLESFGGTLGVGSSAGGAEVWLALPTRPRSAQPASTANR